MTWKSLISVLVTLAVTFVIVYVINHSFKHLSRKFANMHLNFLKSVLTTIVIIIGVYSCLGQFEVAREISKTILQSGSLIIAVATFAAQRSLGNVISGFTLSSNKPCDIGQYVIMKQGSTVVAEGVVTDMTIRHVVIRQGDGQRAVIPNSVVDDCVIVNTNWEEHVGRFVEIEVGYDTDIDRAKEIIQKAVSDEPLIVEKERTSVMVSGLTANGMTLKFGIWAKDTNDSFEACSRVRQSLVKSFEKEGITIPYQTVTIEEKNPVKTMKPDEG